MLSRIVCRSLWAGCQPRSRVILRDAATRFDGSPGRRSDISAGIGCPVTLRANSRISRTELPVSVVDPDGDDTQLDRRGQATFAYGKTDQLGVYEILEGEAKQPAQRFAVNLFDPEESNIVPREELQVGQAIVQGQRHWEPMRFELWKWILIGGMGLLLVEWWIWNRRVYL